MARNLTKPQADFMLAAARKGAVTANSEDWRVARNLEAKGYMKQADRGHMFSNTRTGLEALLFYVRVEDAQRGSMASLQTVEEVERALANYRGVDA